MSENKTKTDEAQAKSGRTVDYNNAVTKIKRYVDNFEAMMKLGEKVANGKSDIFEKKGLHKIAAIEAGRADAYKTILEGNLFKALKQATALL